MVVWLGPDADDSSLAMELIRSKVDPRLDSISLPTPWKMRSDFGQTVQEGESDDQGRRGLRISRNTETRKTQRSDPRLTSTGLRSIG